MSRWLWIGLFVCGSAQAEDALTLLREGRLSDALVAAEHEAAVSPSDLAVQERWIDLLVGLGLSSTAELAFDQRFTEEPDSADAAYLAGRAAQDPARARALYERALSLAPEHARAWMGMGALHRADGRWADAVAAYQRALRVDPKLDEAWGGMIAVFVAMNDRPAALKVATAARTAVPQLAEAWLTLAAWDPDHRLELLRTGAGHAPWDARLQSALATAELRAGQAAAASAAAGRALQVDPSNRDARLVRLAARSMAAGSLDPAGVEAILAARNLPPGAEAVAAWTAVVTSWPRCVLGWEGRAHARPAGEGSLARADLEQALRIDPEDDEALAGLGLALVTSDPRRAAELLRRATSARPHDATLALAAARTLTDAGDATGGLAIAAAAAATHPYDVVVGLGYAELRSRGGDRQGAYETVRELAGRVPDLRVHLAVAAAAHEAGLLDIAANQYDQLARRTGRQELADLAGRIRASMSPGRTPLQVDPEDAQD